MKLRLVSFDSIPKDKILDVTKLKASADDKLKVAKMTILSDRVGNTVGKGETAGYPQFLLFPLTVFFKAFFLKVVKIKVGTVW